MKSIKRQLAAILSAEVARLQKKSVEENEALTEGEIQKLEALARVDKLVTSGRGEDEEDLLKGGFPKVTSARLVEELRAQRLKDDPELFPKKGPKPTSALFSKMPGSVKNG